MNNPFKLLINLPLELQFLIFQNLSLYDLQEFVKADKRLSTLIKKYKSSSFFKKRPELKPIWIFSEDSPISACQKLKMLKNFNEKSPETKNENSLVFRKSLVDDHWIFTESSISIEDRGNLLHKKLCPHLGIEVLHLENLATFQVNSVFEFSTKDLLTFYQTTINSNKNVEYLTISANWLMKKTPKYLKHSKKFRLEINVDKPNLSYKNKGMESTPLLSYVVDEKQIFDSKIVEKPNYDFTDLNFLEDQYFNFSPKDLVLKLRIEEMKKCRSIWIRLTYCDYGNVQLGPGEIDWAFCDLVIS